MAESALEELIQHILFLLGAVEARCYGVDPRWHRRRAGIWVRVAGRAEGCASAPLQSESHPRRYAALHPRHTRTQTHGHTHRLVRRIGCAVWEGNAAVFL